MKQVCVCDHCGLCCRHLIVEADAADVLREPQIGQKSPLGPRAADLSILDACWVLTAQGSCPFLTSESQCRIYLTRPENCVAFLAGSTPCQALRQAHGWAPLLPQAVGEDIIAEIQEAALQENLEDAAHGDALIRCAPELP